MLSEQLTHLEINRDKWQVKKESKQATARPRHIDIPLPADDLPSDIPSPTVSEDGNIESNLICTDNIDIVKASSVSHLLDRRHSLPVLNILGTKNLLSRRQSFHDGPHTDSSGVTDSLDTCKLAGQLYQYNNNLVSSHDQISQLIENLIVHNTIRCSSWFLSTFSIFLICILKH